MTWIICPPLGSLYHLSSKYMTSALCSVLQLMRWAPPAYMLYGFKQSLKSFRLHLDSCYLLRCSHLTALSDIASLIYCNKSMRERPLRLLEGDEFLDNFRRFRMWKKITDIENSCLKGREKDWNEECVKTWTLPWQQRSPVSFAGNRSSLYRLLVHPLWAILSWLSPVNKDNYQANELRKKLLEWLILSMGKLIWY